jgi:hypothetical protein
MTSINLDELAEAARSRAEPMVLDLFERPGVESLQAIRSALVNIYRCKSPERITGSFVAFKSIDPIKEVLPREQAITITSPADLQRFFGAPFCIEIMDDSKYYLWEGQVDTDELSKSAVVYMYDRQNEFIKAQGKCHTVKKIFQGCASSFALPTYESLSEALRQYATAMARYSGCLILDRIWLDSNRLFLKSVPKPQRPEDVIRDSLAQYLNSFLRGDATVLPEQNVNRSQPIDIKVTWTFSSSEALIEIKWLGKAKNDNGNITANYGEERARSGAKQLAGYIDKYKRSAPYSEICGYLAVIDARRRGMNARTETIDRRNGFYYEDREITYRPSFHETRNDFEKPIRMFMEPICED